MEVEDVKYHYINFGLGLLIVLAFASIKPIYKKTTEFSVVCKESIIESNTFFEASKGCFSLKGE